MKYKDKKTRKGIAYRVFLSIKFFVFVLFIFVSFFGNHFVYGAAGVPAVINFQGRLMNSSGDLLGGPSGTEYCYKFSIYDASTGGSKIWPAGSPSTDTILTREGVFDAYIGDVDTLDLAFTDDQAYVNVEVATKVGATCAPGDGAESFESMSPRPRIASSAFAINSKTVGGYTPAQSATNNQIPVLTSGELILSHATAAGVTASGSNPLTFQSGSTGDINFFSTSNKITSSGAMSLATSLTNPLLIGGTGTTSPLTLRSTSGVGTTGADIIFQTGDNGATEAMRILNNGNVGIGVSGPTATLHLKAGTATASTAPLKFTSGINLTSAEAGAMEWDGTNLYITQTSGPTRKTLAYTTDIVATTWNTIGAPTGSLSLTFDDTEVNTFTVNSDTETFWTMNANSLTTGKILSLNSSSLTTGNLIDLQVSGTAAGASQTALNISNSGATSTNAITTYGAQISNTRTNVTSGTNVALYLNASGATTANYGLIVNGGSVGIGTTDPDRKLDILDASNPQLRLTYTDGSVYTDVQTNSSGYLVLSPTGTGGRVVLTPVANVSVLQIGNASFQDITTSTITTITPSRYLSVSTNISGGTTTPGLLVANGSDLTYTSGTSNQFVVRSTFAPTSGTGVYVNTLIDPTINQTGGANGITRGIYINPTLTSAADFRGLDIANNSGYGIYQSGTSATNFIAGNTSMGAQTTLGGATSSVGILNFFNGNVSIRRTGASGLEFRTGTDFVALTIDSSQLSTFAGDVSVPDEAYGVGWDASLEVPTKNALYDKIQTLSSANPAGSGSELQYRVDASTFGAITNSTVSGEQLSFGGAISGESLLTLVGSSTSDRSKVIDITQANNTDESSSSIYITGTPNIGTTSGATKTLRSIYSSLTPTATLNDRQVIAYGEDTNLVVSNITHGTTSGNYVQSDLYGQNISVTGTPVFNDTIGNDATTAYIRGVNSSVSITPTLTNVPGGEIVVSSGIFDNSSTSAGNANLSFSSVGLSTTVSGDLTTTGSTFHVGANVAVSGTADTNYGLLVSSSGASNNYAAVFSAGSVGIGDTTPAELFTVGSGDLFQVNSSGDIITANAENLSITTGTTGILTLDSGTTGAVNLATGNNAKTINIATGTAGNTINIGTNNTTSDTIAIGSALDNIAITSDSWSITDAGALTVVSCTGCGGGGASWNGITNPTGDQALTFDAGEETTWTVGATTATNFAMNADSLTSGTILSLASNGTGALTGQKGLNISLSGANGTGSQTSYGAYVSNTHTGSGSQNYGVHSTVSGASGGGTYYAISGNASGGTAGTYYGGNFSSTASSGTNYGIYVNASGGDTNYAAIFASGNVGIGDTTPASLFTVGSGDLFQINSTGQIGSQQAPVSDYLFALNGTTGNDNSRIIDIVQSNNADEDSSVVYITTAPTLGSIAADRTVKGNYLSLTPSLTIPDTRTANIYGNDVSLSLSNLTHGTTTSSSLQSNVFGSNVSVNGTPVYNDATGAFGTTSLIYGAKSSVSITPTLTSIPFGTQINATAGDFFSSVTSVGDAELTTAVYGISVSAAGNLTTTGATSHYGINIGAYGTADTNYGLYVQSIGATTNYAAIFASGNVGIGDTTPASLFTVGSGDLFQINSTGQIGSQQAPVSDYLFALNGTTGNDNSRIIDIVQSNNADEDSSSIYITGTPNIGTTGGDRTIASISSYLTPTATLNGRTLDVLGESSVVNMSNITHGTTAGSFVQSNTYGNKISITGTPVLNDTGGADTTEVNVYGTNSSISITPTLTLVPSSGTTVTSIAGSFNNSSTSAGDADLTFNSRGIFVSAYGNLTTTGTTSHIGAEISASDTADTNYGIYVQAYGATNNYAAVFSSGNVGVGDIDPASLFTVGSGDLFQVNSSGIIAAAAGITSSGTITFSGLGGGGSQCVLTDNSGVLSASACGGSSTWNGITNPTGDQALTFDAGEETTWTVGATTATNFAMNADSLTSGTILSLASNGTGALTGQKGLNISLSGANGTGSQTSYGAYVSNTHTGSGTNVGLYLSATSGTTNLGLNVDSGQTLLGGTTLTTGTTSKLNIVATNSSNGITTAIAGIHGEYTFNNGGASSYVQAGNRFVFNNAPTTNSNTMVGETLRAVDNTSLANLVRVIEVTANAGSNTAGTNTGIRTTGATFGIQALTNGAAGGVALPAAIYGESTGTTQGDILRLYSNSMTSAAQMAHFYHNTSTFTGTGLLMDFAESSGTFSGNFVDFQKNNTTLFKVTNAGITSLGFSTNQTATSAVCSTLANATAPTADTLYELRDCGNTPVADYAEMYPVEESVDYGDIVATGDILIDTYDTTNGQIDWTKVKGQIKKLVKTNKAYQSNTIGIVSENYGDFSSTGYNIKEENNPMPVALVGRVPVKVSINSAPIKAGEYITTSDEAGKAMKAIKAGATIGKALEDWDPLSGKEMIMVYVEPGYFNGVSIYEYAGITVEVNPENIDEQILNKILEDNNSFGTESISINISELLTDRIVAGIEIITPNLVASAVKTNTLTVKDEAHFAGLVFYEGEVNFSNKVSFEEPVEFKMPPIFNEDTAGFALVKEGDKKVRIDFTNPYLITPVVTANITFEVTDNIDAVSAENFFVNDIRFVVIEKDITGFTILLNKNAPQNIRFSWIALSVRDPKIFESIFEGLVFDINNNVNNSTGQNNTENPNEPTPQINTNQTEGEGSGVLEIIESTDQPEQSQEENTTVEIIEEQPIPEPPIEQI